MARADSVRSQRYRWQDEARLRDRANRRPFGASMGDGAPDASMVISKLWRLPAAARSVRANGSASAFASSGTSLTIT